MTCVSDSCNQGRAKCPTPDVCAMTRIVDTRIPSDADYRSQPHGYEAALPVQFLGDEPKPPRPWGKYALIVAACAVWAALLIFGRAM